MARLGRDGICRTEGRGKFSKLLSTICNFHSMAMNFTLGILSALMLRKVGGPLGLVSGLPGLGLGLFW